MSVKRVYLSGITGTDGALTAVGDARTVLGRLYAVKWDIGTFASGVDFTLYAVGGVDDTTLLTVANANADAIYFPRAIVHAMADGAALTGTSGGDRDLPLVDGYFKLVVASGGDTKMGGAIIYYLDN